MAGKGSVLINFRANADKAIKETKKLTRSLGDVNGSAKNAGSGLNKMAKVGIASVAAGAATAAVGLWNMVEAAVADDAAQRRLAKSLENTTGATDAQVASVEEWITAQGRALGVTDDELRPALERLARSTGDVGKAQELAAIAMDIAAATGKPLATVSAALAKAYDGNTGALARMGIKLDEGPGKWETLAAAVDGSAESQAESVEGSMERVKIALAEAGESVGTALLPSLQQLADWLSSPEGTQAIEDFGKAMEDLGPILTVEVPAFFDQLSDELTGPGSLYENLMQIQDLLAKVTNFFRRGGVGDPWGRLDVDPLPAGNTPRPTGRGQTRSGGTVNVTINNPKTESAADSAALALRIARRTGGA